MTATPLKLSINLYSVDLLPKKLRLSFLRLTVIILLIPIISSVYSAICYVEQEKLASAIVQAETSKQRLTDEQEALKKKLALHKPASQLLEQVSLTRQRVELTQQLLAQVSSADPRERKSYQVVLQDLATTADGSTWLTHIVINGDSVNLSGETQQAAAVPAWIKRLSETQSLAGVSFNQLIVNRDENNLLQFHVNSHASVKGEAE